MSIEKCKSLNLNELLTQVNKLEEENKKLLEEQDFLISISHDLRTPLNTIISTIQLLKYIGYTNENVDPKLANYINIMQRNSYSMLKLVNNLIDITRLQKNKYMINKTNIEVVSLIKSLTKSVEKYAEVKSIKLHFDSNVNECYMSTDSQALSRILLNLISNSIKFTPENKNIYVNIYKVNSTLELRVIDEGIGIPEEDINIIFDRFVKSRKNIEGENEGSGIGLDLVSRLTKELDGTIKVYSKKNKGTEFIISLPININNDKKIIKNAVNNKVELLEIEFSDIYN